MTLITLHKTIDYIKPTQRDLKPDIFVVHVETNDLLLNKSPKEISEDIIILAESMKTENNKIIVSRIVCYADSFREIVDEANAHLEEICVEKDIALIGVGDNSPFVIGDSVSSNDIFKMKKQRLYHASNTITGHLTL